MQFTMERWKIINERKHNVKTRIIPSRITISEGLKITNERIK